MTTQTTYHDIPAYARLSRKSKGGQVESVPLQFATLGRVAEYRGDTLGQHFDDKALSAWDETVHRAGWEAFLAELDTGTHRAAYSYHADRLSRNGQDTERLLSIGARWGIMLITPEGVYDLGNDDSRAMFRMLAAMTINQSDAGSRRARNHKSEARRQGNLRIGHGGPPPLGFRQGRDDWEVDPEQAQYLAEAARRVLAGEKIEAVHRDLGPMTTSPAGPDSPGRPVSAKMLRAALTRPVSAGLITDTEGREVGVAEQGGPLDEPTFRKLAVNFGSRKRGRPAEAGRYPLGPVLRCGKCGNQLTGERVRRRGTDEFTDYYACKNPHKGLQPNPCHGCSVPAQDVHDLIRGAVELFAQTPAARRAAARGPETAARRAELDAQLADLLGQSADLDAKRLRIRQPVARARYDALAAEAEAMIEAVEDELAELERIEAEPGVPVVIDWDAMTQAEKLATVAEAVETPIVVQPGNGGGAALSAAQRIDLIPVGA